MARLVITQKPPDEEAIDHYKEAVQVFRDQHSRPRPLIARLQKRSDDRSNRTAKYLGWVWLYADGILKMLPTPGSDGMGVAVFPMVVIATRSLLDSALALQFYGIDDISEDEAAFRRMYFLGMFDARDQSIRDAGEEWNTGLRVTRNNVPTPVTDAMCGTKFFRDLSDSEKRRLLKFPVDATFATHSAEDVAARLGITRGRYRAIQRLTSQFSHFLPYAMIRMARVGEQPGGVAIELAQFINEAADILNLAVRGAESVVTDSPP